MGNGGSKSVYPLVTLDQSVLTGASSACLNALNANVSCGSAVGTFYGNLFPNFASSVLDGLCNGDCASSLKTYRDNIRSTCAADATWEDVTDSSIWPVTYLADKAIYGMNLTCLRRSNGTFCNTWFQEGGKTASSGCDECYLELARQQALSPVAELPHLMRSAFSSLSSSCSYTGSPITQTVTNVLLSSPTATRACVSIVPAAFGDTPVKVSGRYNVSTYDLLTANGLRNDTRSMAGNSGICIRNQCRIYQVLSTDTCQSIAKSKSISLAQLLAWNPAINGVCSNLNLRVGQHICLTNPLGDFLPGNNTDDGSVAVPPPANIASQTTTNCAQYHNVTAGDDCGLLGLRYDILYKDFRFLNPMINDNCTNLWLASSYCVRPVGRIQDYPGYSEPAFNWTITPESGSSIAWYDAMADAPGAINIRMANGTREDCYHYIWRNSSVSSPTSCEYTALNWEIEMEELLTWNPSLNASACSMLPSSSYCVGLASPTPSPDTGLIPPAPRAAGEIANCGKWQIAFLDCASHVSLARLSMQQFYEYNPSVGSDCSGMVNGTYYCIKKQDPTTTTSGAASTTIASGTTPTPTQSGMASGCNRFYKVKSGDGCYDIANAHGITLNDFYAWNPAVGSNCQSLQPDYYVCVGRAATSTSASATASATSNASTDGLCGRSNGKTCRNSGFGGCCSSSGYCGFSAEHCGSGCQKAYGDCDANAKTISPDGTCGGTNGYTCAGSQFGKCCSSSNYCGSTSDYCGSGCQSSFGTCG